MKYLRTPILFLLLTLAVTATSTAFAFSPKRIYPEISDSCSGIQLVGLPREMCSFRAIEIRGALRESNRRVNGKALADYGVIFAMTDSTDYFTATLTAFSEASDDGIRDNRHIDLTISHIKDGKSTVLETRPLKGNIDIDRFDNTLAAEINCATGQVNVLAGKASIDPIVTISLKPEQTQGMVGFTASQNAIIELAVGEYILDPKALMGQPLSEEAVMERMANSGGESPAGVWNYLDRNTDAAYMRPGGKYTIAVIPSVGTPGFDIIYLDGAEINNSVWSRGMLKGRLTPTPFQGHYNLLWFDAEMNPITDECSATLENSSILRLDFPLLKSSIRFSLKQR